MVLIVYLIVLLFAAMIYLQTNIVHSSYYQSMMYIIQNFNMPDLFKLYLLQIRHIDNFPLLIPITELTDN